MTVKQFIGSGFVLAREMNRAEYNKYRDWLLPSDEDGTDEGYLVEAVADDAFIEPNHPDHVGYISWLPKENFESYYSETTGLTFGMAIEALRTGCKVAREGWNGKGMWLILDPGTPNVTAREGSVYGRAGLTEFDINPHVDMKTATGEMQPGWLASQTDMLATDWQIVP